MPEYDIHFPELHDGQRQVLESAARFKVICCGRRWGKTMLCSGIALDKAMKGKKTWWLAPDYAQSDVGWEYTKKLVGQIPMPVRLKSSPPKAMVFPTGGEITFRTTYKENLLRGSGLDCMIIDEADYIDEVIANSGNVWNGVLRPSLADRHGEAIFISTPRVEGGYFNVLWDKGQKTSPTYDPAYESWRFSSYTNPYIPASEWDDIRVDMPSILFRQEILAEFISSAGARIRKAWLQDRYKALPGAMEYPAWRAGLSIAMGVDLAISQKETADFVAVAVLARDAKGYVYVLDVQRMRGGFHEQVAYIKSMADKWLPDNIGVESNGYQLVMSDELLLQTKYNIIPLHSSKDKQMRFAPLEARYERMQVYHINGLPLEFEQELFSFPNGRNDDQIDAMSCAWAVLGEPVSYEAQGSTGAFSTSGMYGEHHDVTINDFMLSQDSRDLDLIY